MRFMFVFAALGFAASFAEAGHCFVSKQRMIFAKPAVVAQVVEEKHFIPVAQLNVAPDYYYSVNDYYRDQILVDAIVGRLAQLQANGEKPPEVKKESPKETPEPAAAVSSVNQKLVGLVQAKCSKCHGGTNKDRLDFRDLGSIGLGDRLWMFKKAIAHEMPKGGPVLTEAEIKLFKEYADQAEIAQK